MKISGREYPDRPPGSSKQRDRVRRLAGIVSSLRFAMSECTEPERALYKTICQALAHAENHLASQRAELLTQDDLFRAMNSGSDPTG